MNSHNEYPGNNALDGYLRRGLKSWAFKHQPPETSKARLLLIAAGGGLAMDELPEWPNGLINLSNKKEFSPFNVSGDPVNSAWLWVQHLTIVPLRYGI